jgi:hypothetical protein
MEVSSLLLVIGAGLARASVTDERFVWDNDEDLEEEESLLNQ